MWKAILQLIRPGLVAIGIFWGLSSFEQQSVIVNKDNTHPEINILPTRITTLTVKAQKGYNEVQWTPLNQLDNSKYLVEYSSNGADYNTAGVPVANKGNYVLNHYTSATMPLSYRLRIEDKDGRYYYSQSILLEGVGARLIKLYPTILTTNIVNLDAAMPVDRIMVYNTSGNQVFAQEVGGKTDYFSVTLPRLASGNYFMAIIGKDLKTTERFIVP